jgi:hypothetical protein
MKKIYSILGSTDQSNGFIRRSFGYGYLKFCLFLTFTLSSLLGFSQVSSEIDTTRIRIGEQIQYQIIVNETDEVQFSKLILDSLKRIEVVESFEVDSLKNRLIKKYALTSFDSGRYVLPGQTVFIRNKKFLTDSVIIDVATVAVDTIKQPMYTIKEIRKEPYTFGDIFSEYWWLLVLLIVIAVILYFVLRDKVKHYERINRIPPFDLAKQRLKELDSKKLLEENKIKLYYVELTDIVRTFIEREMNIPALESTTDELLETITDFNSSSKLNIPEETIIKLQKLLQEADLVKFAKSKPLIDEIETHRSSAEVIIDNLHPKTKEKNTEEDDGQ